MRKLYHNLTSLASPLITAWLYLRLYQGKEDKKRIGERFGFTTLARPAGTLLWLHAASVGEANSVLLLITKIRERFPETQLLLTTGTVTSARLMQTRLPKGVLHQYVPVDTPQAVARFMWHWKPDIAFWVESEFWPNLVLAADDFECFMGVINARLSQRSFQRWQKYPDLIRPMLSCFNIMFAQSDDDAKRLQALGAKDVLSVGNLKYDAALLPCDEAELVALKNAIGARPIWLAASTHPGEETIAAEVHRLLSATRPNLLTVIVPRHPQRGAAIAAELAKNYRVALRSRKEAIANNAQIYIADTLGELGLFYRLCEIVFMGGSLVRHGGQNPLEPARLACAIVTGPYTHNFADMYQEMEKTGLSLSAKNAAALAAKIDMLLNNASTRDTMQKGVKQWVESKAGAADRVMEELSPIFSVRKKTP